MSVSVKRKRGRPRLDEPREIKDFDNNLIHEFQNFPVFYDRQHPQHRNREHTDRIWQRIAQNLNVSTNLAKTRMLQLRNRFNLEKRRVEAMQQNSSATSQWSLYERLSFLSNYVKTRRPYSLPTGFNHKASSTVSSSAGEDEDDGDEIASNKTQDDGNISTNNQNVNGLPANQNNLSTRSTGQQPVQRNILLPVEANKNFGSKYKAFGQFLTSSLIEMNEIQALGLIEKFTTDLVKYLKIEEGKNGFNNVSQKNNTDDCEAENSLTVY